MRRRAGARPEVAPAEVPLEARAVPPVAGRAVLPAGVPRAGAPAARCPRAQWTSASTAARPPRLVRAPRSRTTGSARPTRTIRHRPPAASIRSTGRSPGVVPARSAAATPAAMRCAVRSIPRSRRATSAPRRRRALRVVRSRTPSACHRCSAVPEASGVPSRASEAHLGFARIAATCPENSPAILFDQLQDDLRAFGEQHAANAREIVAAGNVTATLLELLTAVHVLA